MELARIIKKLIQLKEMGLNASWAVRVVKSDLQQSLYPTRYEVEERTHGSPCLVGVLEDESGRELDRVRLSRNQVEELYEVLNLDEKVSLKALAGLANGIPREFRPLVAFYPFAHEKAYQIIQAVQVMILTYREDSLGNPLRGIMGADWRKEGILKV